MLDHGRRRMRAPAVLGLFTLITMMCFGAAHANAVQTSQYDEFSACPTDAPLLNDPTHEFAICGSGTVQSGSFTIGDLTIPLSAPVHAQFAGVTPDTELEDCSPLICLPVSPGSTTLSSEPIPIRIPALQVSPHHQHGSRPPRPRHRHAHASHVNDRTETIVMELESAGDIRHIALDAIFGAPVPEYELPVKLHLRGRFLGSECYVGSDSEPIVLAPLQTVPATSSEFLTDPNGFEVETLKILGATAADDSFSVPAANGCGPRVRGWRHGFYALDDSIDALFGLPSLPGESEVVFLGSDLALAISGYNEVPPDGGAALRAAFDAAR